MVKKILFTIAVVAFLAASVQAVDPGKYKLKYDSESDPSYYDHPYWPYEYIAVEICTIPILMDVGYFVQLEKCGDYKIKLLQVPCGDIDKSATKDFPCYDGCVSIKVRANFDVKLGGEIVNTVDWWGDGKVYYSSIGISLCDACVKDIVPGDGDWHVRKVCVKAWDIKIWDAREGRGEKEFHVADLEITVKPTQ